MTQLKPPATTVAEWTATLLWEACRREPRADSVRRALDEGADIEWAASAAADHRVSPLLWRALGRSGSLDVLGTDRALGGVRDALKMEALLLLPRAVALAVQPLTDAGLEPVVFKGPAVAARYPEPGLRPMDDIDLLLPQADHRRALDALGQAGWQVARAGDDAYDTSLIHGEVPSLFLELHYGLEYASHRVSAPALDADTLWARRQPLDCAGTPAFGLPPVEELVMLAVHAGKHSFVRLVWIADLAMIVGAAASDGTAIDWDRVRAVAGSAGCMTVVGVALEMAHRAGVDTPAGLFPLPTRGRRGDAVGRLLSVTWPLTRVELPRTQLIYTLTHARSQRAKFLFVHVASGRGLPPRLRRLAHLLRRALARARPRASVPSAASDVSEDQCSTGAASAG